MRNTLLNKEQNCNKKMEENFVENDGRGWGQIYRFGGGIGGWNIDGGEGRGI